MAIRSHSISPEGEKIIRSFLDEFKKTHDGKWIEEIPVNEMEFKFRTMSSEDTLGMFSWLSSTTIFLRAPEEGVDTLMWITSLFSTVVHELRHAWQWKKNPIAYLLKLPFRNFTLEKDAKEIENKNLSFAEECGSRYAREIIKSQMKKHKQKE